jgi:hypothetical protein
MDTINEVRLTGYLIDVAIEQTKNGKTLAKLTVETDPPEWKASREKDQVQVTVFGRNVNEAQKLQAGQFISILARVEGNEFNGKRYVKIIAEKFKVLGGVVKQPPLPTVVTVDDSNIPF